MWKVASKFNFSVNNMSPEQIQQKTDLLEKTIKDNRITLLIRGTPDKPFCGYSGYMIDLLKYYGINQFIYLDIQKDKYLRKVAKDWSKVEMFPQLWIDGQFIGTQSQVDFMHTSSELGPFLKEKGLIKWFATDWFAHFDDKVKKNQVCLFMKGNPEFPQCGFSNYVVQILKYYGIEEFSHVDILKSDEVRQKAKEWSQWPTFPQLYINGELIGGCDIISEMHNKKELADFLKEKGVIE